MNWIILTFIICFVILGLLIIATRSKKFKNDGDITNEAWRLYVQKELEKGQE